MSKNPREKFTTLYRESSKPLTHFIARKIGNDKQAAQEIFAQTFAAAWKGFATFEHKSKFFTWLCRIALNKMADYYRHEIHERSRIIAPTLQKLANLESNDLSIIEALALKELRISVHECIDLLPPEKKQLLYLRYWRALSIKKIAALSGSNERVIEGKLYRARQELKRIITANHPELL